MKHAPPGNSSLQLQPPDHSGHARTGELAPAELAYLMREGDMTHTMLVLIVDLVQRAAKSGGNVDSIGFTPYEKVIWTNVSDHVKRWTQQKIDQVAPVTAIKNPWQWATRWRALRTFIGETLHDFISETIKDPLHIRKYFSWSGIVRFGIELYTSSARAGVESALRSQLQENGFLVPSDRRQRFAMAIARLGGITPLTSLKQMLGQSDYDETFSDVMAIYGVETLWLLS